MSVFLNNRPAGPLVDEKREITIPWFLAFLQGGALTALIDLVSEVTGILKVGNGGSGRSSLTVHDVLVGNGTSPVTLVSPSTAGFVLTSNGVASDPSFQATTSGTVTHTGTLTANQLVYGNGGADIKVIAATDGQIPIGKSSDGTAALATLTGGTNITVTNAANSIIIAATGGAGGTGNSIYATAVGSEPGTPNTGDADLYTNGAGPVARYSGSLWATWGPIFAFTKPVSGDFSWANQGGASIDTTNGGVYLLAPTSASDNIRYRYKAVPSTPYTLTIGFLPQLFGVNFQAVGFAWSDGTKYICASFAANGTQAMALSVTKFTNATTFSADYLSATTFSQNAPVAWLKCQDDGTNRIVSWSQDSQHWVQLHSVNRTDFLTATQVGFFANSNNAMWPAALTLLSWQQS
jgi:hypothetical protein